MKILVLFTGGTIGSTVDGATVHTDPAAASRLLSLYRARFGEDVLFEVRRPCNLLSENATPGLWSLLERSVREEELAVYDGVIITHGSDTLPYTCAALAFLLRDVPIPLVLVASNYSLGCHEQSPCQGIPARLDHRRGSHHGSLPDYLKTKSHENHA